MKRLVKCESADSRSPAASPRAIHSRPSPSTLCQFGTLFVQRQEDWILSPQRRLTLEEIRTILEQVPVCFLPRGKVQAWALVGVDRHPETGVPQRSSDDSSMQGDEYPIQAVLQLLNLEN